MTLELLRALFTIARFCEGQSNCEQCVLKELCGKMPCEI
jgi:hypothetical protein